MKFIVDTQLPPRLAAFLADKNHDAVHTTFFPAGHLIDDESIRQIAIEEGRTIISKDKDFFDAFLLRGTPPQVLLLRLGNISNHDLLVQIDQHLPTILELFENGAGMVQLFTDQVVGF